MDQSSFSIPSCSTKNVDRCPSLREIDESFKNADDLEPNILMAGGEPVPIV
jgi:hypothetical protein